MSKFWNSFNKLDKFTKGAILLSIVVILIVVAIVPGAGAAILAFVAALVGIIRGIDNKSNPP